MTKPSDASRQQGSQSGSGKPGQQQQQGPERQPNPGGGEPEVQEDIGDRGLPDEQGSRRPQVDVERE